MLAEQHHSMEAKVPSDNDKDESNQGLSGSIVSASNVHPPESMIILMDGAPGATSTGMKFDIGLCLRHEQVLTSSLQRILKQDRGIPGWL